MRITLHPSKNKLGKKKTASVEKSMLAIFIGMR
jgi:hypothetical protein